MSLQELPKTAANGALKLIRMPVELATGARELIAGRLAGSERADAENGAERAPKTAPKPPKPAGKPKAKTAARAKAAPKPRAKPKPKAKPPKPARPARTPTSKSPAAEEPGVVTEQTEGLEDATDRAVEERRGLS